MAKNGFTIGITGGEDLAQMIDQLEADFGKKDSKRVLVSAVRDSLAPALSKAKQLSFDGRQYATGELSASLRIEARKPTKKDRRSVYVSPTDVAIAKITTAPKNKLVKIRKALRKRAAKKAGRQFDAAAYDSTVQKFDGRAVAQEFGTAKIMARPYLRPALESTAQDVINRLADRIRVRINEYRAKQIIKG